ncbi:MAG TPA: OmpH family outer membrane protein [Candidatus Krumholzibacteria bacterium]|nr:OmpH family outer membrane protein [Candidatus Krumholzibacteria bacterium]HPD71698.1 OmpH family outer membrane protein [Candidatus Krumholzibacteria bacterium]HRY41369.1 OmpH family outer membrane protein [Candidatus Krumholzibacteria bacterium]
MRIALSPRFGVQLLGLVAVLLAPLAARAAEKPLGIVDSQRIWEEYPAAKDVQEQWEKYIRDVEKEVAEKERALTRLAEEISSQKMLLGEEALNAKMQNFEQQKAEYNRFREQIDQRVQQEYQTKTGPITDQVKTIAERIGKEEGFGLIIDVSAFSVLFLDPDVDLTNKVLAALARGDQE